MSYTIITSVVNANLLETFCDVQECSLTGASPATHVVYNGELTSEEVSMLSMCDVRDGDMTNALLAVGLKIIQ